jgi:Zn-dependent protease with chaperone function
VFLRNFAGIAVLSSKYFAHMSPESFDRLVAKLESSAAAHPGLYHAKVVTLALLGFTYLAVLFLISLAVLAGSVALVILKPSAAKLGIILGIASGLICWSVLRACWTRFPKPEGIRVTAADFPELHQMVGEIRAELKAPPVHSILIDGQMNAAIMQNPRLGLFGWYRNYLLLGLPLLRSLSVDQARSVIAHELGHLSGQHGRISAWIYRVRSMWAEVANRMAQSGRGRVAVAPFLRWYVPFFNAYSFVLARAHEYQADQAAVRIAGADAAGKALLRVNVVCRHTDERFWPAFQRSMFQSAAPPSGYMAEFARSCATVPPAEGARWVGEAVMTSTNRVDTHPCLRERLIAMGYPHAERAREMGPPPHPYRHAAKAWLGERENEVANEIDERWAKSVALVWAEHHKETVEQRKRLGELTAKQSGEPLQANELYEIADLTNRLEGEDRARPLLEEVVTKYPEHAVALFTLGCIKLDEDDASGEEFLQRAMRIDPAATTAVHERLFLFHDRHGRRGQAQAADKQAWERSQVEALAEAERAQAPVRLPLHPHGLPAQTIEKVRAVLARHQAVSRADIVRVETKHLPELPFYLVTVKVGVSWWTLRTQGADAKLVNELAQELDMLPSYLVIMAKGPYAKLARKAAKIAGARVWER